MSVKDKNLSQHSAVKAPNASKYRFAIVVSEYNEQITGALRKGCIDTLLEYGVKQKHLIVETVPGAYELPIACNWMYERKKVDAVIALGCVIKGDTDHDKYINYAVSQALMMLGIETGTPFVFGVITPNNLQQAKDRAGGKHGNKGVECAVAALKMLALKDKLKSR
jgi:6,7-dimethyl-8-ribityllumazine synthase